MPPVRSRFCATSQRVRCTLIHALSAALLCLTACSIAAFERQIDQATTKTITDGAYHYQMGPAPTWVETKALPKRWPAEFEPEAAFRVWRMELQWNLEQGEYVDYAWEATNTKSVELAGQYDIEFDPSWQELVIHEITRTRGGKRVDLTAEADLLTLARREKSFEAVGFSGRVSALVVIPSIQPGDVMRVRYSTLGLHPLLKHTSQMRGYYLESQNPVLERRIRVYGKNLRYRYDEGAEASASKQPKNYLEQGEFSFTDKRLALDLARGRPQPWPDQMPSHLSGWAELHVAQQAQWTDIATWGVQLFDLANLPDSAAFQALVKRIRGQAGASPKERALAAARYVQDEIRYFAVHMGESTHRPHSVQEVLERGYGDCKDKAQLLTQLLRALGIQAYPALVHSQMGERLRDLPPSAGSFDHAIVYLEINQQGYWIDATRTQQGGNLNSAAFPNFATALVLRDETNALMDMKPPQTPKRTIHVEEKFEVNAELDTTLDAVSLYRGGNAESLRRTRADVGDEQMRKDYEQSYARMYANVEQSSLSFADQRSENALSAKENYRFDAFWESSEPWRYADFYAHAIADPLRLPEQVQRSAPMALRFPNQIVQTLRIVLPESIDAPQPPSDLEINDAAFVFRRTVTREKTELQVRFEYQALGAVVEKDVNAHIRNRRRALDALSFRYAVRVATPTIKRQERMRKLLDALAE